ncbi:MAG: penicillin acylase family protein [Acidobacteria bacterium]|nr:MAG: penicillin acylase family protein [Acidobacteriota bacterium]
MSTETTDNGGERLSLSPRLILKLAAGLLVLALIVAAAAVFWLNHQLKLSLPKLEGTLVVAGLSQPVDIERDSLGVPTIRGGNRFDVALAQGFVHAQDRFFQMDLMRRRGAGELSILVGSGALGADHRYRRHRFRTRARRQVEAMPVEERRLLDAYTTGVNAALKAMEAPPFEYLALRTEPVPWRPEDTLLVVYSMYFELHDDRGRRDSAWGLLHDILGPEVYEFLAPWGTEWDTPVVGEPIELPPTPGPEILDLRTLHTTGLLDRKGDSFDERPPIEPPGSNNWAVAGVHTARGGAILASDMHLALSVPNIWYRASLVYPNPENPGRQRRITGVTLPGVQFVIAGSNEHIAWGLTNTYGDWVDLIVLEPTGGDPFTYETPDGIASFDRPQEVIEIKGGKAEVIEVLETIWGPVIDEDYRGRRRVLKWIAHDPRAVSSGILGLEAARSVEEAVEAANRAGSPPQNFAVADADGRVAWTVMGPIPKRFGFDGRLPGSWADGSRGWSGWLEPGEYPRIVDPEGGKVWSANNRVVDGAMMGGIGHGGYILGARARQIRDRLSELRDGIDEKDLLAIQLDDQALFLERWQRLLLDTLTAAAVAENPRRGELRELVENWGGQAAIDSVGFRMVRAFRNFLTDQVLESLTAICKLADARFDHNLLNQSEGPVWRLVSERPLHLLDPQYQNWDEQLLAAVDTTIDYFEERYSRLADATWGARNTARIRHPLSQFMPGVGHWLDMPADPLPGDANMPRVQSPTFGASERMVVSPGDEGRGIFHMPTGQSGHPLSPHYRDGHQAWVEGEPTPFLPGPPVHLLQLLPAHTGAGSSP